MNVLRRSPIARPNGQLLWRYPALPRLRRLSKESEGGGNENENQGNGNKSTFDWEFPWRHHTLGHMQNTLDSDTLLAFGTSERVLNWIFLKVPLWDVVAGRQWRVDLERGAQHALIRGVAGILSQTYGMPLEELLVQNPYSSEEEGDASVGLKFEYETGLLPADNEATGKGEALSPGIEDMMDRRLRDLFTKANSPWQWEGCQKRFRIELEITPKLADFHVFNCVPFVPRDTLETEPHLLRDLLLNDNKELYTDMRKVFHFTNQTVTDQLLRRGMTSTTIAAEVFVVCDERFVVKDLETGQVRQGDDEPRRLLTEEEEIGHLVILERQVDHNMLRIPPAISNMTNWQIVDIDNMLGQQKWYHVDLTGVVMK